MESRNRRSDEPNPENGWTHSCQQAAKDGTEWRKNPKDELKKTQRGRLVLQEKSQ